MKVRWKKTAAAALAGLFIVTAAGCGGGDKNAGKKEILKVGVTGLADTLEPADYAAGQTLIRWGQGETLAKFDKTMHAAPWLAERWQVAEDKLTWTFTIRDSAKFAEAKGWARIGSMKAEGQTLTIRTTQPLPHLPGVLCDPRFTVIDTSVKNRDIPQRGPVCTGPYTVTSFARDKAVLEANPHYWDGPVPFKGVELPVLADPHTRAMALKKGQVDVALDIASGDLTLFQDANTFRVSETESVSSVLSLLNVKPGKPLADKRIRDALIFCLDRPAYCKTLLKGTFIPGGPVLAPGLGYGYETLMQSYGSRQDVGKSKKLLAEAGWKDTNRDGFVDKDGKTLEIGFTICTDRAELPLFAEAVKLDAKNVGIKVNIKTADRNALEQARKTGDYDMLIHAFDALSDALAAEAEPAKQKQMLLDMQKILLDDTAVIVFGYPKTNIVSRTGMIHADVSPCDDYRITRDWKRKE